MVLSICHVPGCSWSVHFSHITTSSPRLRIISASEENRMSTGENKICPWHRAVTASWVGARSMGSSAQVPDDDPPPYVTQQSVLLAASGLAQ